MSTAEISDVDVNRLLDALTLAEKVSLLSAKDWWRTPAIDREDVFVPYLKCTDGPNGARGESYVSGIKAACFPGASNLGATFDTAILFEVGKGIAAEAITKSANILLAPTLNVIRSPLGGRNYETFSEDPVVLGELSAAFVNGCQSLGIAATPKHFVANEAENQRKTLSVELDEQTLREIYLLPFQLVMKLSKPWCFMTSYNKVNGIYVADSPQMIEDVLRREWGFSGLVISDWMGTYSTAEAVNAGMDLEMPGPIKMRGELLLRAIKDGLVTEKTINKSVLRVLQLAKKLGRFEDPLDEPPERAVENSGRDSFIAQSAAEGMVLLKNENRTLPIPSGGTVAVIGQFAHMASLSGGGSARVDALHAVTPLEGLVEAGVKVNFSNGVPVYAAVPHAKAEIQSVTGCHPALHTDRPVKVEWFNGSSVSMPPVFTEMISRPEYMIKEAWPDYLDQEYYTRMTVDITPETSGDHLLSVISTGMAKCYIDGQLVFERPQETVLKIESFYFFKAKLERRFDYSMKAGRRYTIVLEAYNTDPAILNAAPLFGKMFQGAALRFTEHVDISDAIQVAVSVASVSDYAVVCVGTTNEVESEGYDRETMDLPGAQVDLIRAVAKANTRTIVVNFSGAAVTLDFADDIPTILQAWYPGQECGHSVAQVLTGRVNPCGHLPFSWPARIEDNSAYENFPAKDNLLLYAEALDVGYRYHDRDEAPNAQFPFGYGLSYTTFDVSKAETSDVASVIGLDNTVKIGCKIHNTGSVAGKVAVQFYVQTPEHNIGHKRPVQELKAFKKIEVAAGETKLLDIGLDKYAVSMYDTKSASWRAVAGTYIVRIGMSSRKLPVNIPVMVSEEFTWTGL